MRYFWMAQILFAALLFTVAYTHGQNIVAIIDAGLAGVGIAMLRHTIKEKV